MFYKNSKINWNKKSGSIWVGLSIIVAGLIIAGAVMLTNKGNVPQNNNNPSGNTDNSGEQASLDQMEPVTDMDHIRGDINAPVVIVEYSDTECPFCKQAHMTIKEVVDSYNGQVAWVYRHFPLFQIHPKAPIEARATECVAELGGEEAFWTFLDRIYEVTPSNNGLDHAELPNIAEFAGVDKGQFEECFASNKYEDKVQSQYDDAVSTGGRGTPWSIVIGPNGEKVSVNGAQPKEAWISIIDGMLQE